MNLIPRLRDTRKKDNVDFRSPHFLNSRFMRYDERIGDGRLEITNIYETCRGCYSTKKDLI
jgi:hypothetical protein